MTYPTTATVTNYSWDRTVSSTSKATYPYCSDTLSSVAMASAVCTTSSSSGAGGITAGVPAVAEPLHELSTHGTGVGSSTALTSTSAPIRQRESGIRIKTRKDRIKDKDQDQKGSSAHSLAHGSAHGSQSADGCMGMESLASSMASVTSMEVLAGDSSKSISEHAYTYGYSYDSTGAALKVSSGPGSGSGSGSVLQPGSSTGGLFDETSNIDGTVTTAGSGNCRADLRAAEFIQQLNIAFSVDEDTDTGNYARIGMDVGRGGGGTDIDLLEGGEADAMPMTGTIEEVNQRGGYDMFSDLGSGINHHQHQSR
jgi:hypothetical protein